MFNMYGNVSSHVGANSSVLATPKTTFFTNFDIQQVFSTPGISFISNFDIKDVFWALWSFITIARVLFVLLLYTNFKNAPFIWTVRIPTSNIRSDANVNAQLRVVNAFRFCTKTMRPQTRPTSAQLFQPLITTSVPPLSEIDIYMHSMFSPPHIPFAI